VFLSQDARIISAECPEMFLLLRDFLIICMPAVEALETVDTHGEDRVEAEVTVVDLEEPVVDSATFP